METMTPTQPAPPIAAPVAPAQAEQARTGDWVGGVLIALILPVIGVIVGLVYIAKGGVKRPVGITTLSISVVTAALSYVLLYS